MNSPQMQESHQLAFTYSATDDEMQDIFLLLQNPQISLSLEQFGMVKIQAINTQEQHTLDASTLRDVHFCTQISFDSDSSLMKEKVMPHANKTVQTRLFKFSQARLGLSTVEAFSLLLSPNDFDCLLGKFNDFVALSRQRNSVFESLPGGFAKLCLICNKSIKRKKKIKCFSCQRRFHIPCLVEVHQRGECETLLVEQDLWTCDFCIAFANVEEAPDESSGFSTIFSAAELLMLSEKLSANAEASAFAPLVKATAIEPTLVSSLMLKTMQNPQNLLSSVSHPQMQTPVLEAHITQCLKNSKHMTTGHFFYTLDVLHEGESREWFCFPVSCHQNIVDLPIEAKFPYVNCVQQKGDLVVFHPNFCKFNRNLGFSISERLNFAPRNWLRSSLEYCCQNRATKRPPLFSLISVGMVLYAKAVSLRDQALKNDCIQLFEQIFCNYSLSFMGFLLKNRSKVSIVSSGLNLCKECNGMIPHLRLECNKCKAVFCSICVPKAELACKVCENGIVYVKISSHLFRFLNTVENV